MEINKENLKNLAACISAITTPRSFDDGDDYDELTIEEEGLEVETIKSLKKIFTNMNPEELKNVIMKMENSQINKEDLINFAACISAITSPRSFDDGDDCNGLILEEEGLEVETIKSLKRIFTNMNPEELMNSIMKIGEEIPSHEDEER